MKKLIALLLLLASFVISATACFTNSDPDADNNGDGSSEGGAGNEGDGGSEDEGGDDTVSGEVDYGDATVFTKGSKVLVVTDGGNMPSEVSSFTGALSKIGVEINYGTWFNENQPLEIIVGNQQERDIAAKANSLLSRIGDRDSYFNIRYLVYAESGTLAIAYDENELTNMTGVKVIADELTKLLGDKEYFASAKGIVLSGTLDLIELQEEEDAQLLTAAWAELEDKVGEETANAFRELYSMYGEKIPGWIANLYDPGTGGFYASSDGRNGETFGPDVQCTVQLLRFIASSGMVSGISTTWTQFLPESMQYEMIYFAKSLQDPNGYFYHPQWGKAATDNALSRRGRDLGWATSLLTGLGARPQYTAANDVPGDGISADAFWDSLGIDDERPYPATESPTEESIKNNGVTSSVGASVASAVSKVIAASDDSTAYLQSHTAFIDYMLNKVVPGMKSNPYSMGNNLNATYSQIKSWSDKLGAYTYTEGDGADYQQFDGMNLKQITIKALNDCINPQIGMWGDLTTTKPLGTEFRYTNGYFKVMSLYNDWGIAYPAEYIPVVADSLMKGLMGDEPSTGNICEVYNVWSAICYLRTNLKYVDPSVIATDGEGNQIVDKDGNPIPLATYIRDSVNSILAENAAAAVKNTYKKVSGYQKVDGGFAHSYSSGTANHQGLPVSTGANISDVDATCIGSTGLTRAVFEALGLEEYKIPLYTESDWMRMLEIFLEQGAVIKYGGSSSKVQYHDYEELPDSNFVKITNNGVATNTFTAIQDNGNGVGLYDKVTPSAQLYVDWLINYTKGTTSVVWESDLKFSNISSASAPIELRLYNGKNSSAARIYTLYIYLSGTKDGSTISIAPKSDTSKKIEVGKVGEWFNLSLRYSVDDQGVGFYKVYINGAEKPVLVDNKSETAGNYIVSNIGFARFIAMTAFVGKIYFDDTAFKHETAAFENDDLTHNIPAGSGSDNTGSGSGSGSGDSGSSTPGTSTGSTSATKDGAVTFDGATGFPTTADNGIVIKDQSQYPNFLGTVSIGKEGDNSFITVNDTATGAEASDTDTTKDRGQLILLIDRPDYTGTDDTFVFEAKFRTRPLADGTTLTEAYNFLDITFRNAEGTRIYRTYFGGGKIGLNTASVGTDAGYKSGEWYTVRIEYKVVGTDAASASWDVKCYVNDTLVSESTAASVNTFCNSKSVDKVGILLSKNFVGQFDIDDVKLYQK